MKLLATPFHVRAADFNRCAERGGFAVAASYGDFAGEALAARFGAAIADISWRARLKFEGAEAAPFLSRLLTRDARLLAPGNWLDALWLGDNGAVRGSGRLARYGSRSFVLTAPLSDASWIAGAAEGFDVRLTDISGDEGGLAVMGPTADTILCVAGLDAGLAPGSFRKFFWRGLDVTLARVAGGYELWCPAADALVMWDRVIAAGRAFAGRPAGLAAMDILDLENGIVAAGRDFTPGGFSPGDLGLGKFIDTGHSGFNGCTAPAPAIRILVGLALDSRAPAPLGPLLHQRRPVGQVLASLYSPALRRAIALASVEEAASAPGTAVTISAETAHVTALPFLPQAAPIDPTELSARTR